MAASEIASIIELRLAECNYAIDDLRTLHGAATEGIFWVRRGQDEELSVALMPEILCFSGLVIQVSNLVFLIDADLANDWHLYHAAKRG